jgi:hypothetical protein
MTGHHRYLIYGLQLRNTTNIRYVGLTTVGVVKRLKLHKGKVYTEKSTYPVHNWIRKYGFENIEMVVLELCPEGDLEYLYAAEARWEGILRAQGADLKNAVPCGHPNPRLSGQDHPLFGVGHSPESRYKISKNHADVSGTNNPNFGRGLKGSANPNFGTVTSEQKKINIRNGQRESVKVHKRLHEDLSRSSLDCVWCCYSLLYGIDSMSSFATK